MEELKRVKNLKVKVYGIVLVGGSGSRLWQGNDRTPKQERFIKGKPIMVHTLNTMASSPNIDGILVVAPKERKSTYWNIFKEYLCEENFKKIIDIIDGGASRQESSWKSIAYISKIAKESDIVVIHDGARCFVKLDTIESTINQAKIYKNAITCVKCKDSVRNTKGYLAREDLYNIQTPQTFEFSLINNAYLYLQGLSQSLDISFEKMLESYTDESSILDVYFQHIKETSGKENFVNIVDGDYDNIKVTTKEDISLEYRIGKGYDVHRLSEGIPCIIGGVKIDSPFGLVAHSDGDVLTHAIIDAILGACSMGDIGRHFPDSDEKYRDVSSIELLKETSRLILEKGYGIINIDATVICERPRIADYVEEMKENISKALNLCKDRLNIKGTTTEKLGFAGRGEGIASEAVCMVVS